MARGHRGDPVSLDREGRPVSPQAMNLNRVMHMAGPAPEGPGREPVPEAPLIEHWRADPATFQRNGDAWELAQLLSYYFEVTPEEYRRLPGDLKRHFAPCYRNEFPRRERNDTSSA